MSVSLSGPLSVRVVVHVHVHVKVEGATPEEEEECLLSGWEGVGKEGVGVVVEEEEAVEAVEEGAVNTLNRQLH